MPDVGGIAGEQLRSFIERIERLEEEKRALSADIKDVYAEAKGSGFDIAIMRQIIRIRRMDQDDVDEQETLLDIYKRALGMLPGAEPAGQSGGIAASGSAGLLCSQDSLDAARASPSSAPAQGTTNEAGLFARRSAFRKGISDARCRVFDRRPADARLCPRRCSCPNPKRNSRVERLHEARHGSQ